VFATGTAGELQEVEAILLQGTPIEIARRPRSGVGLRVRLPSGLEAGFQSRRLVWWGSFALQRVDNPSTQKLRRALPQRTASQLESMENNGGGRFPTFESLLLRIQYVDDYSTI